MSQLTKGSIFTLQQISLPFLSLGSKAPRHEPLKKEESHLILRHNHIPLLQCLELHLLMTSNSQGGVVGIKDLPKLWPCNPLQLLALKIGAMGRFPPYLPHPLHRYGGYSHQ